MHPALSHVLLFPFLFILGRLFFLLHTFLVEFAFLFELSWGVALLLSLAPFLLAEGWEGFFFFGVVFFVWAPLRAPSSFWTSSLPFRLHFWLFEISSRLLWLFTASNILTLIALALSSSLLSLHSCWEPLWPRGRTPVPQSLGTVFDSPSRKKEYFSFGQLRPALRCFGDASDLLVLLTGNKIPWPRWMLGLVSSLLFRSSYQGSLKGHYDHSLLSSTCAW